MTTDIRSGTALDLLVGLAAQDADARALVQALDPEIREVAALAEQCALLSRIPELSEEQADRVGEWFRLVQLEGWGSAGLARKRFVLAEMVEVYRRRGTRWAWDRVTSILETPVDWDGGDAVWDEGEADWDDRSGMYSLTEWWEQEPDDPPYTYRVDALIEHRGLTLDEARHLREVLAVYLPARAELLELSETIHASSELVCAGHPELGLRVEVLP